MMLMNVGPAGRGRGDAAFAASDLAASLGSVRDAARAEHMLGMIRYYRRDLDGAEEFLSRAQDWLERTADGLFLIQNLRALSLAALARGDLGRRRGAPARGVPARARARRLLRDGDLRAC